MFLRYKFPWRGIIACCKFLTMQSFSYLPSLPSVYRSVQYMCFKSFLWQYLVECDEVVLMKDGQIAEQGTHDQLMARGRDYAMLITSVQQEVEFTSTLRKKHLGPPANGVLYAAFCTIYEAWPHNAAVLEMLINSCPLYFMRALIYGCSAHCIRPCHYHI